MDDPRLACLKTLEPEFILVQINQNLQSFLNCSIGNKCLKRINRNLKQVQRKSVENVDS